MKRMLLVMAVLLLGLSLAFAQGGKEESSQAKSVTLTVYSPGNGKLCSYQNHSQV